MNTVLSTDNYRPAEREAFWRHVMSDTFAPVSVHAVDPGEFAGSIDATWAGRLMIADVRSSGQEVHRTPREISNSDNAYFQIALVASGAGRVDQDDRQAEVRPGDMAVYETTRPFQWRFDGPWDVWGFTFPADAVGLTEHERRLLTARRLDGHAGLTGVVARFLMDLARHAEAIATEQSERVLADASDMIVTLLSSSTGMTDTDNARGAAQRSLMLRAKDHIDQHLGDASLGPAEIAAAINISPRYLHKLFESEHQTVALYIRALRLERVRHRLLDPRFADQPIAAVAHNTGFSDLSGFNRAFKAAFGVTPSELRDPSATPPDPIPQVS